MISLIGSYELEESSGIDWFLRINQSAAFKILLLFRAATAARYLDQYQSVIDIGLLTQLRMVCAESSNCLANCWRARCSIIIIFMDKMYVDGYYEPVVDSPVHKTGSTPEILFSVIKIPLI